MYDDKGEPLFDKKTRTEWQKAVRDKMSTLYGGIVGAKPDERNVMRESDLCRTTSKSKIQTTRRTRNRKSKTYFTKRKGGSRSKSKGTKRQRVGGSPTQDNDGDDNAITPGVSSDQVPTSSSTVVVKIEGDDNQSQKRKVQSAGARSSSSSSYRSRRPQYAPNPGSHKIYGKFEMYEYVQVRNLRS